MEQLDEDQEAPMASYPPVPGARCGRLPRGVNALEFVSEPRNMSGKVAEALYPRGYFECLWMHSHQNYAVIRFPIHLEKWVFSKKLDFATDLLIKSHFSPKTKMVQETPRSIFYMTDPRFNDPKIELWTKSDFLGGRKFQKSVLRSKMGLSSFVLRPKSL